MGASSAGGAHLFDDAAELALFLCQPEDLLGEGFAIGAGFRPCFGAVGAHLGAEGEMGGGDQSGEGEPDREDGDGFLAELEHGAFPPRGVGEDSTWPAPVGLRWGRPARTGADGTRLR